MIVYIYDYAGKRKKIEISKPVQTAFMLVLSGDQILFVKYTDGTEQSFDSCDGNRQDDFFDGAFFTTLSGDRDFLEEHKNMY